MSISQHLQRLEACFRDFVPKGLWFTAFPPLYDYPPLIKGEGGNAKVASRAAVHAFKPVSRAPLCWNKGLYRELKLRLYSRAYGYARDLLELARDSLEIC